MERKLARRIAYGLGANTYAQMITVFAQLAGVPILLHAWGVQVYGEWLVLFAIPAYLSMVDLGFTTSAANDMTQLVGAGKIKQALSVFRSLCTLLLIMTSGTLLAVSLVVFLTPAQVWPSFAHLSTVETRWVLWLLAVEVLVRFWDGANHAGYRCNNEYALHVTISNTVNLLQYVLVWATALCGYGMFGAAMAYTVARLVATPIISASLVTRHQWLRFGFDRHAGTEVRRLVKPSLANLAMPLAQALNLQGMTLVVAAVLGPIAVVTLSTLRTLTNLMVRVNGMVSHTMEPEFATLYGRGDTPQMRFMFTRMVVLQGALTLAACLVLILLGDKLLAFWTNGRVEMNHRLFVWLLLASGVSVLWHGALVVLQAANRHMSTAVVFVIGAAGALMLAYFLLRVTGNLADVGLALLLTNATVTLLAVWGVRNLLAKSSVVANALVSRG